jgi:hypothetical protein
MRLEEYRRKRPRRPDPDEDGDVVDTPRVKPTLPALQWLTRPDVGRELDNPVYRRRLAAQAAALSPAEIASADGD